MPENFTPPSPYARQGWKVKIRDKERVEPPHVTILFKMKAWRYGLRERRFLDRTPDPGEVPDALRAFVDRKLPEMIAAWDRIYPHNKVESED